MVQAEIISKILNDHSMKFVIEHNLHQEHFFTFKPEFKFIEDFYKTYNQVPTREIFLDNFPDFQFFDIVDSDEFLINKLNEEVLFNASIPIFNKTREIIATDSVSAIKYCIQALSTLAPVVDTLGIDLNTVKQKCYEEYRRLSENKNQFLISSGFKELDDILGGIHTESELITLFARTGQAKSFILLKILLSAWEQGKTIGIIEPEMDLITTNNRWDTLYKHFSNYSISQGFAVEGYKEYCNTLPQNKPPIWFTTLKDFDNQCNVAKIRNFIQQKKIDILGIDGISYLYDDRRQAGDSKTTQITHIAEDLMQLSQSLHIPILIVSQANRGATTVEGNPEIENIRDSDGLAFNSSIVLSLKLKDNILTLAVKKNRRGKIGEDLHYSCDLDTGIFTFKEPEISNNKPEDSIQRPKIKKSENIF